MRPTERGFSLVEAAVVIGIIAILAGALAPLALQTLNRQREHSTRDSLKVAFEAMFGARDRRVANLRADIGFHPTGNLNGLAVLVNPAGTAWAGVPAYGYNGTAFFMWGWNGPYWNGPTDGAGNPVDAWGKPIRLIANGTAWQVASNGQDGLAGTADDLYYPSAPATWRGCNATLNIVVTKTGSNTIGTALLSFPYGATGGRRDICLPNLAAAPAIGTQGVLPPINGFVDAPSQVLTWNVPAGTVRVDFRPTGTPPFTVPPPVVVDLLPGETRQMEVWL